MPRSREWFPSRSKPANICRYFKDVGLCVIFPHGNGYKFVVDDVFHGPFETQIEAQIAAENLRVSVLADSPDDEESNMTQEANSNGAAQQEAPQYVSVEKFRKLVAHVNELTANYNKLAEQVEQLERKPEAVKQATKQRRSSALEAEIS